MIDLDELAGPLPTGEGDIRAGVRVVEYPGQYDAVVRAGLDRDVDEVSGELVISGVTPVAIDIGPSLSEVIT